MLLHAGSVAMVVTLDQLSGFRDPDGRRLKRHLGHDVREFFHQYKKNGAEDGNSSDTGARFAVVLRSVCVLHLVVIRFCPDLR